MLFQCCLPLTFGKGRGLLSPTGGGDYFTRVPPPKLSVVLLSLPVLESVPRIYSLHLSIYFYCFYLMNL